MEIWARRALKMCLGAAMPCSSAWEGGTPSFGAGPPQLLLGKMMSSIRLIALAVSCSLKAMGCLAWLQDATHYTRRKFFSHLFKTSALGVWPGAVLVPGWEVLWEGESIPNSVCPCFTAMARSWHPSSKIPVQPLFPSEATFRSWGNSLDPFLTLSGKFPRLHTLKKKSLIQKTKGGVI